MIRFRNYFLYWSPVLLWMVVIFFFSNRPTNPGLEIDWLDFIFKKSAHLGEYAIYFALITRAIKNTTKIESFKKISIISMILLILYAITDEFHQSFIIGRTATVRDVLIDATGGLISCYAIWKLLPKMPKRLKDSVKNWLEI